MGVMMRKVKRRLRLSCVHPFFRWNVICSLCFLLVFSIIFTGCAQKEGTTSNESTKSVSLKKETAKKEPARKDVARRDATKAEVASSLICNNARLSDDDTIRQIASFFAACMTKSRVTADDVSFQDCETILRMMLVHTDAIIDSRVKVKDSVVSVDLKVAKDYISQLFNRDMPAPGSSAQSSQAIDKSTIYQLKNSKLYFGNDAWDINHLNYSDTVSDDIRYGDDGVINGTFLFNINDDFQATVELTLVPSKDAFRYYVVSYQVNRESRQPVSTATAKPSATATPYVCQEPDERLADAIDSYDSGHYDNATPIIKEYAEKGNAIAQRYLADAYQYSRGVTGSAKLTFYWYSKAAEQGEPNAECFLGSCYRNGTGTDIDLDKMLYWYEKSVDQENKHGLINLGYCYHKGIGVKVDLEKARDLYERADAAGHPYAKKRLAELNALCGK